MSTISIVPDEDDFANRSTAGKKPNISATEDTIKMQEIVMVTQKISEGSFNNSKRDTEFLLKSKINENFRKASAFWKAT